MWDRFSSRSQPEMDALIDKIQRGDRRSLARAMSTVEDSSPEAQALKDRLRRWTGQVPWWGFTGPPGVGKSTLLDALLGLLRERGHRVGVVAVDPSSPMSDGALLGDRVRMMRHAVDRDVFIRSLAARQREGGLSDATVHCGRLLELAGYDPVLIETVGVGQNEVDVASVADACIVVLGPGHGDEIQLIKAGLLEIADIVVVNKCDLPEANRLLADVREELGQPPRDNVEPFANPAAVAAVGSAVRTSSCCVEVVGVEAKSGKGVDLLLERLLALDGAARDPERRKQHRRRRVLGEIRRSTTLAHEHALERRLAHPAAKELVARLERGELSLDDAVRSLLSVVPEQNADTKLATDN